MDLRETAWGSLDDGEDDLGFNFDGQDALPPPSGSSCFGLFQSTRIANEGILDASDDTNIPEVDDMLSSAMKKMSVKDMDHVLNEVHGVPDVVDETQIDINELLQRLEDTLQAKKKNTPHDVEEFMMAELQDRRYVSNRAFLAFG